MSDEKKTVVYTAGASPVGMLGVAFVILKLCGVINWPWLWVLAPFWVGLAFVLLVLAVVLGAFAVSVLVGAFAARSFRRKQKSWHENLR